MEASRVKPSLEPLMPHFDELLEAAREQFPQLVDEYLRLRLWVGTCVGADVALPGGPEVE